MHHRLRVRRWSAVVDGAALVLPTQLVELTKTALATVVTATGVLALTPLAARMLVRFGVIDHPSARSAHTEPVPRGAGLVTGAVLAASLCLGVSRLTFSLAVVSLLATALGGTEDIHGTRVLTRILCQFGIACVFVASTWTNGAAPAWSITPLLLVFIVGYVNAFNFMDGANGVSVAGAVVAGLTFAAFAGLGAAPGLGLVGAVVAVAAICFLPFNFPRARVFLGDGGSYSFGAVIACTAVTAWRSGVPLDAVLSPLAIYLVDTSTAVLRRAVRGELVTASHRDHTFQRLLQLGASHTQAAALVFVFSALTALSGLALVAVGPGARVPVDVAVGVVCVLYLTLPVAVASRLGTNTGTV